MAFPILMYHGLWPALDDPAQLRAYWAGDPQMSDPGARHYAMDVRRFAAQTRRLAAGGARTPASWADLDRPQPPRAAWITFDDGHRSNFELALPSLESEGLRAIFFITTDWIGRPGFMSEAQVLALRDAGMLIGAHGATHRLFTELDAAAVRHEMARSKARLEQLLGEPVPALSLPGGRLHPAVPALARELGYRHVFTSEVRLARAGEDSLAWPRIALTTQSTEAFVEQLLAGDERLLARQARRARLLRFARAVLGERGYQRLRGWAIKRSEP